jgi:hypothetical protein
MLKDGLYKHDTSGDPAISFATDADIKLAERLRHELEDRYLARSAPSLRLQVPSRKGH